MGDLTDLLGELEGELGGVLEEGSNGHSSEKKGASQFLGPYELIEMVGEGGVARVFRSRHVNPAYAQTIFAFKLLHDDLSKDPRVIEFFQAEAYILSLLRHRNIVRTFEAGVLDQRLYIAMEFVEGKNLEDLQHRCKQLNISLPREVSLHIIAEIARALYYAHSLKDTDGKNLGLIHRDVNPANVFLSYDGRVLLGDFGVAMVTAGRLEKEKEMAGKVGYFAPEQISGDATDHRADLFALGVILFEVLMERFLFDGSTADDIVKQNKKAKIPKLSSIKSDIIPQLESVVLTALERNPRDRFQTAHELLVSLDPYLRQPPSMSLAVASVMRSLFVSDYMHQLNLKNLLHGQEYRPQQHPVLAITHDPRAQAAFQELLSSKGYQIIVKPSMDGLKQALDEGFSPHVVLVDVHAPTFSPMFFKSMLSSSSKKPSVIAITQDMNADVADASYAIGASDILFKPYGVDRVLSAIQEAAILSQTEKAVDVHSSQESEFKIPILIISSDYQLVARLSAELLELGFAANTSGTASEGVTRLHKNTYHAVVTDVKVKPEDPSALSKALLAMPGIERLPIVYLASGDVAVDLVSKLKEPRSAVTGRDVKTAMLASMLEKLINDLSKGRSFLRYPQKLQVRFRHGGLEFEGYGDDIGRGGMMIRCSAVPALGAVVGLTLILPDEKNPIEVRARVARVEPAGKNEDRLPGTGVNFVSFAGDGEERLVNFIMKLSQQMQPLP